jgi:hypothetical protein
MLSSRIALKVYINGVAPELPRVLEAFHGWIREKKLPETLIDVVDYSHVHHGPAVLLIGHESDYALDLSEGRAGLSYQRKRAPEASPGPLSDSLKRVLRAVELLEQTPSLTPLQFSRSEFKLSLLDRLNAPNTSETRAACEAEVLKSFAELGAFQVEQEGIGSKEPFTLRLRVAEQN